MGSKARVRRFEGGYFGWSRLWHCCGRRGMKIGLKNIEMLRRSYCCKDAGCRNDSSTKVGRMKVSAKPDTRKKEQRSTGSTTAQNGTKSDEIPEVFRKWEQKARTSKQEWKWQRGIVEHPLSGSQWNRGHFSMRKWESQKYKSWGIPAEGFKGRIATDGPHQLFRSTASGKSVVNFGSPTFLDSMFFSV